MNPWSNENGCEIFFEELAAIDEHGADAAPSAYRYHCAACGCDRDEYKSLADCVRDARRHIEV
jgi:hypothetical protein